MDTKRICPMTMEEYQAVDAISKSGLDLIHRSPAHYLENKTHPKASTPAQQFGSMLHMLVLEPERFHEVYSTLPDGLDRRTKEGKAAWEEWQAENEGKTPLAAGALAEAEAVRDTLMAHSRAQVAITGGVAERCAFFWKEPTSTGPVPCKARFDYLLPSHLIVDLKTTTDARIEAFSRQVWAYRYHVQAAWYLDAYRDVSGEPAEFLFVAVEKEPPFAVSVYRLDDEAVDQGRREYQRDLNVYAECRSSNVWPAYPEEVGALTLPTWAQEVTSG